MAIGKLTPAMLNAMPVEDRVKALNELFPKMEAWAAHHIACFRWNRRPRLFGAHTIVGNGSCFFLDFSGQLFLVTAAHVYDGYLDGKQKSGAANIACQIDNIPFDPAAKLRGYNRDLDIATFEFSYDDLIKMGKQAISGSPWPPPEHIPEGLAVWFGGFPGINRLWIGSNKMSLGISMGHVPITTVTLRQITCRFDREQFVSAENHRTAPSGFDRGGMSGGPLLLLYGNEVGEWYYWLGGVIFEARSGTDFETVVAVRAHFINPDGSISRAG
jgi:hypothetical protein